MPAVNIKFIVSSSESERNFEAENLLRKDANSRTKWKGKAGASSNSVVFQLEREVELESLDIGNESSALIEIFVAKSADNERVYHVLIPSTSLMSPMESRLQRNGNRVTMFSRRDMIQSVAKQKWDIVKVSCCQPFNDKIPYGLSFITFIAAGNVEKKDTEFVKKPMERSMDQKFDKRLETSTDKCIKMLKEKQTERKDQRVSDVNSKGFSNEPSSNDSTSPIVKRKKSKEPEGKEEKSATDTKVNEENVEKANVINEKKVDKSKEKVVHNPPKHVDNKESSTSAPFNKILSGVRFTLSGYKNPLRSQLRQKAKEMGAFYEPDWTARCTHLICAFRNTPKFRQVGSKGIIVSERWIDSCYTKKKRLPERLFALV
ncbi:hypothetical protein AB6A40_010038 [Gnathostoma spinigerum]|uniref:BRCT domain-containing protein n=1 Tax=Gnathostoma spinigerum TaxID=75299 RepID=A0ABD6F0R2_9BILA